MAESLPLTDAGGPLPAHLLFVVTRNVDADASATHVLRTTLWGRRRGATVNAVLIDDAVGPVGLGKCMALIEQMAAAGVDILAHAAIVQQLGETAERLGIRVMADDDLAALLRTPGIQAVWC